MGGSKSSRIIKNPSKKNKNEVSNEAAKEPTITKKTSEEETTDEVEEFVTTDSSFEEGDEKSNKKLSKSNRKRKQGKAHVTFSDRSISNLSRGLGPNDWIKLAYALGFLPQGIAHFTGRASSAQNSYSQCSMMLKTWRELTPKEEILPRLCNGLKRIRRHDLAVKMGLELGISVAQGGGDKDDSKLLFDMMKAEDSKAPLYEESKKIFTDKNVSFLSRQILAREEWKRLAYALGFYPDDASQIIASASSSQNLYAQAHLMLMKWRNQSKPSDIIPSLKAAFIRIRRHDLVFLLDLGVIAGSAEVQGDSLNKLKQICQQVKKSKNTMGQLELSKFSDLQNI